MSILTILIVAVFCIGYLCIALESLTKINKAAIALLMCVLCWTLLMTGPAMYYPFPDGCHDHCGDCRLQRWFQLCARHNEDSFQA